jgi:aminopeptidase N
MRTDTPRPIRLKDYQRPAWLIDTVDLKVDLHPTRTRVDAKLRLLPNRDAAAPGGALHLDGEGLELARISIDRAELEPGDYDVTATELVIPHPPQKAFTLALTTFINPETNTALQGLYRSRGVYCTQCEAQGFRRITYFIDRPDVLARYTVRIEADRDEAPVLLSNGNPTERGTLAHGKRHYAVWKDPHPKPCYLFALVGGDLSSIASTFRTASGRDVDLAIYVEHGKEARAAWAMDALKRSFAWDEKRFGREYDLDVFNIVAVSDFNMGAMENKGLNIFNDRLILASPDTATDMNFEHIESVVAHEYFHNWTGNRITCRDWFQLSLKEGLTVFRDQEFSQDMAGSPSARAVCRIGDVRTLRQRQFPEDAGAMAHPVRPDAYAAIDNFYTPTIYEKGAEVVRMMHTLVGRDGFARGMKLYFQRHDGQAVTCDDFAQAIADANEGSALKQHLDNFKRWYAQAGTPRLQARGTHDAAARTWTLTLRQRAEPSPGQTDKQPFVIPVAMGLLSRDGRALPLQLDGDAAPRGSEALLVLTEAEQRFTFVNIDEPPVPSLLRGFSAPVLLDDGLSDTELLVLLAHDHDAFNRWEAGQRLGLARLLAALPNDAPQPLDGAYVHAMRELLRHPQLDPAFKELALQPPAEGYVAEQVPHADPQRIHAVREHMLDELSERLHDDWLWAWNEHPVREGYDPGPAQAGRRALANLALAMLVRHAVRHGTDQWPGRAYQRVKDAANMTDRLGALQALVSADADLADEALSRFHARFKGDALAIDKWFQVQALAPDSVGGASRVLARARELLQHPDFSLRNPNRARSLLLQLCIYNPAAFHRADASGYVFWAEQLLALDALNPQLASRLARAMDRWASLAEPYRAAAREAVARVAAKADLSPDTREVVTRALESGE